MTSSDIRGHHLHIDGASGAAGDMVVGALIDAGVPVAVLGEALDRVGVGADRLQVTRVVKAGISATDVKVRACAGEGHGHRHYRDIVAMISAAGLSAEIERRSLEIFAYVARAEAGIHATEIDEVVFHEVGAIDSIVDIVATAAALAWLAPRRISATPVAVGSGSVACAHGALPVPAPATLEILRAAGAPMIDGGLARELCTPTGAAILAASVTEWGGSPTMTPIAIGYGAGDAELGDRANVVRVVIGSGSGELGGCDAKPSSGVGGAKAESMLRVEANIDDMSPEMCEHVAAVLFERGAVDVWWTQIVMKRSRPALQLSALVALEARDLVVDAILRETTTIGVRFARVERSVLERDLIVVDTDYGALPIKVARIGAEVVNAAPEYEPCRRAAAAHKVALKQVYAAVVAAYQRHAGRAL